MIPILRIIAASCICSVGIIFPQVWFLTIVGLALFFNDILFHASSVWRATWRGILFGTLTGGAGTAWFLNTLPLDFLGIQNETVQVCAVVMTWLYVALSLGAPVTVCAVLIYLCRRSPLFPVLGAFLWGATEVARMWSFAITTWAPTSLFGPHFSVSSVGYALTENPTLLQLAHPFGLDALNCVAGFVAAQLAIAPALLSAKRPIRIPAIQAIVFVALVLSRTLFEPPAPSYESRPLRFAILAENFLDVRDFASHAVVRDLVAQAAAATPPVDAILMPEELSLTSLFWSKEEATAFIKQHFGERDVLILNSRSELFPADETNENVDPKKLVYDSTVSGEVGRYVKLMLMPLGEYAPAFTRTFFSVLNDPELQLYIDDVVALPPRGTSVTTATFQGVTIGGLLCADILSPKLYNTMAQANKPDVLVNLANQFWFHGSRLLHWKTVQMARVHAVQNRLPFLLANNMAPAFALDSRGKLLGESAWGQRDVLYVDVNRSATGKD